jgi:hypothetical protein
MLNTFSEHLQLSAAEVESLLSLSLSDLLANSDVQQLLGSLDVNLLRDTLGTCKLINYHRLLAWCVTLRDNTPYNLGSYFLATPLPTAGAILAQQLPPFYDWLKHELGIARVPDRGASHFLFSDRKLNH